MKQEPLLVRLYRRLLVLYPQPFRDELGQDSAQLFGDIYRDALKQDGWRGACGAGLRAFVDLLVQSGRERVLVLKRRRTVQAGRRHIPSNRLEDLMERFLLDLRNCFRAVLHQPGLSALIVVLIALGIGLDVALFSVLRATLIRPLPFEDPDELVVLVGTYSEQPGWSLGIPEIDDLVERSRTLDRIGAYSAGWPLTLTGNGEAQSLTAGFAAADFFTVLGGDPTLGRTFVPAEDEQPDAYPVVVLSHRFWQRQLAGDPEVLERRLELSGRTYDIIGVLGQDFRFADMDIWLPLSMSSQGYGPAGRRNRWHLAVARLPSAAALDDTKQELDAVMANLEAEMPMEQRDRGIQVYPLREFFYGQVEQPVKLLFAGAALVMLICCINVGALLLIRAISRRREMAVRAALGAPRGHLLGSFLGESLVLTIIGGGLGIVLAESTLSWIGATFELGLPVFGHLELDSTVLFSSLALILVVGITLGFYPALSHGLGSPMGALRSDTRQAGSDRLTTRRRSLIIAFEVGLALVLSIGAGLTAKSFYTLAKVDLGFETENLLTMRLNLKGPQFDSELAQESTARRYAFAEQVKLSAESLPGVESATFWGPSMLGFANQHKAFAREGTDYDDENVRVFSQRFHVGPGALAEIGIPMVAGREFSDGDGRGERESPVIIDQSMAATLFPEGQAVGKRLYEKQRDGELFYYRIIGIARDARHRGPRNDDARDGVVGDVYQPYKGSATSRVNLLIKTAPDLAAGAIAQTVRQLIHRIDPDVAAYDTAMLDERFAQSASIPRFSAVLMTVYAAIAALLAFIGTYGLLVYTVRRRRNELAVRTALGADRGELITLVLAQGLKPVLAGLVVGTLAALGLSQLIQGLLFGVERTDLSTYLMVVAGFTIASILACYLPARRASQTEPMSVLRHE